jgi:large subunit ribosomal protein L23
MTNKVQLFDIIKKPVITERATTLSAQNKVVFKVANGANKTLIKEAVEKIFNVKVASVNTISIKGKNKVFRGRIGTRQDYKKAVVTLVEGQTIDVMGGVK